MQHTPAMPQTRSGSAYSLARKRDTLSDASSMICLAKCLMHAVLVLVYKIVLYLNAKHIGYAISIACSTGGTAAVAYVMAAELLTCAPDKH